MKLKEYELWIRNRFKDHTDVWPFIGLFEEAGEVAGWYKKSQLRKNPAYTEQELQHELGDVLNYLIAIAQQHKWSIKDIMKASKMKLDARDKEPKKYGG